MAEKSGFKHFMLKEIFEQPRAIEDTLRGRIDRDGYTILERVIEPDLLDKIEEDLRRIEKERAIVPAQNIFEGQRTVRIYNLLAYGAPYDQIPVHPAILPLVERVLDRGCLVSSLSSIAIDPGETVTCTFRHTKRGQVTIVNFIFTRCDTVCPVTSAKMHTVQERTADEPRIKLVSISVDPAHDTVLALKAFAAKHGADDARWRFARGDIAAIKALVEQGMRIGFDDLGGAVDVHVRVDDELGKILTPVILGVIAWAGLYLRDPRLRALLPLKR